MTSGFLVVDKPAGITSHDVVSVLRAMLGIKKVGHTGTLDPFATGVLPMAVGSATRLIQFLDESSKTYVARIQLGVATDTGDLTGETVSTSPVPVLSEASLAGVADSFVGERMQVPPAYSAVKVKGKPLYKYAREGEAVQAKARRIVVYSMDVQGFGADWVDVCVVCSRGTYVRVLAEEFGHALGTHGHLTALRRTSSGPFSLDSAVDFTALSVIAAERTDWQPVLRPRRDQERVKWRSSDEVRAQLAPRFATAEHALSHLPRLALKPDELSHLRLRGRTTDGPQGVDDGGHWLAFEGQSLLGVMVRQGAIHRVARMLPQP